MSRSRHLYISDETYAKMEDLNISNISHFVREKIDEDHAEMIAKEKEAKLPQQVQLPVDEVLNEFEDEEQKKEETSKLEEEEWQDFCANKENILEEARVRLKSGKYKDVRSVAGSLAKYRKKWSEIVSFLMNNPSCK